MAVDALRARVSRSVEAAMEFILLGMVCLAPWGFGAVPAEFESLLYFGVAALAAGWGICIVVRGEFSWAKGPVALLLAGLFLVGLWQLTPIGRSAVQALSPATARWYGLLMPSSASTALAREFDSGHRAGQTLSVYPHATRLELLRLLAVFLVFSVVLNHFVHRRALRRFLIVVVVNGVLLSLFAFVQFFTSRPGQLYWSYPSDGQPFGPFVNRNHFSIYINVSLGLGLGLLWYLTRSGGRANEEFGTDSGRTTSLSGDSPSQPWRFQFDVLNDWLRRPATLPTCAALGLMLAASLFSLSRGGIVALVGASLICLLPTVRSVGVVRFTAFAAIGVFAVSLLTWFGLGRIQSRWDTLKTPAALQEGRLYLWSSSFSMIADFPLWGTGYGTYQVVDPLYRTSAEIADADLAIDHPHNDYLELLVEGGLVALALGILAILSVFRSGFRRMFEQSSSSALASGALFGFTTFAIHSAGEFGSHIPAIVLLVVVVCAHLSAAGTHRSARSRRHSDRLPDRTAECLTWRGIVAGAAAIICFAMAGIVAFGGLRLRKSEELHGLAEAAAATTDPARFESKQTLLEQALTWSPDSSDFWSDLGDVRIERLSRRLDEIARKGQSIDAGITVASLHAIGVGLGPCAGSLTGLASAHEATIMDGARESRRLIPQYVAAALEAFLKARDHGPLLPRPYAWLAFLAERLDRPQAADLYRQRAQALTPSDPKAWYEFGSRELEYGQPEQAWKCWRRSLELSNRYFATIVARSARRLNSHELLAQVLPERPVLLLNAAQQLYSAPAAESDRVYLLKKALTLLDREIPNSEVTHTRAVILRALGRTNEAVDLYRDLLTDNPSQTSWRIEFAQVLRDQGQRLEACTELEIVLAQKPTDSQAFDLLRKIGAELLQRK